MVAHAGKKRIDINSVCPVPTIVTSFADAQDDIGEPIRLSLPDTRMGQYVGVNALADA